ncbi:MAG: T9SS type A sorting domain-containing protein [Bacteroidota bacterium]
MPKHLSFFVSFVLLYSIVGAQNLRVRELFSGKDLTGDTITIQSRYTTWVGAESLDLYLVIENKSNNVIETGAKKMELDSLQKDVMHTFCFAGNCFPTGTYISPSHAFISGGSTDSSFIAHYLFDNTVHVRGINHVAYVFYNTNSPTDSAVIYVTYNSVVSNTGINAIHSSNQTLNIFPNPASTQISFTIDESFNNKWSISIINLIGKTVFAETINNPHEIKIPVKELNSGLYFIKVQSGNEIYSGRFLKE